MVVDRMKKIDELVKEAVAKELAVIFTDKIISITKCEVSKDLAHAKIWISSLEEGDKILEECKSMSGQITRSLSKTLMLRRVPRVSFYLDDSSTVVSKIEKLIKEIHKDGS